MWKRSVGMAKLQIMGLVERTRESFIILHKFGKRKLPRKKTSQLILLLSLLAVLFATPTGDVSAAMRGCRADPIFKLSDGDILTVTLEIGTEDTSVKNVTYILHVPAGVSVMKAAYTAGGIGTKEVYKLYQDSLAKTYTTDTVLTTQSTGNVAVTATTRLNSVYAKSASGYSGQHLIVTVSKP